LFEGEYVGERLLMSIIFEETSKQALFTVFAENNLISKFINLNFEEVSNSSRNFFLGEVFVIRRE